MERPLLAIHVRELSGRVAIARHGIGWHGLGEGQKLLGRQTHRDDTQCFRETIAPASAHQRYDVGALRGYPGDRDLRDRAPYRQSHSSQSLDQEPGCFQVLALEARADRANIALAGTCLGPVAADQAAR